MAKKIKRVHYRSNGKPPYCLFTNQPDALTREEWSSMCVTTDQTNTNIARVTCPACLRQIMFDIKQRMGG